MSNIAPMDNQTPEGFNDYETEDPDDSAAVDAYAAAVAEAVAAFGLPTPDEHGRLLGDPQ